MDFKSEINSLYKKATELVGKLQTEEATKTALVLPFIRALGYDIFSPTEVVPEYTADVGIKKGEKVDYAIFIEAKPIILFECKIIGDPLDESKASQLYRYFTTTDAPFGLLTDGVKYKFYSDLDVTNKMDSKPFFIFDLLNHSDRDLKELKKFGKASYDEEKILENAYDLKYGRLIDTWLRNQFSEPSDEFVKLVGSFIYPGRMTASNISWLKELLTDGIERSIRTKVRDHLQSALDQDDDENSENLENQNQKPDTSSDNNILSEDLKDDGIITTEEELEGFRIVQAIVSELIEPERVFIRDARSYCAILMDNNNRKPICRLRLDGRQMRVSTFVGKEEILNDIEKVTDIFKLAPLLKETVNQYEIIS